MNMENTFRAHNNSKIIENIIQQLVIKVFLSQFHNARFSPEPSSAPLFKPDSSNHLDSFSVYHHCSYNLFDFIYYHDCKATNTDD